MGSLSVAQQKLSYATIFLIFIFYQSDFTTAEDVFNLGTHPLLRVPRENNNKHYLSRYGTDSLRDTSQGRPGIKPEDSAEARQGDRNTNVEKRCSRCDASGYPPDYRNPYESRNPYETRNRYDDRYDDRYDPRRNRDRYDYDDRRYDEVDRYDRYDRRKYYERRDRYYERRPEYYDRYDRDRYDRERERYDRYDRYNDRGVGYDNRGYDYRGGGGGAGGEGYDRDRGGYRPWDETYRGSSGWDNSGRGYYFATGRPEAGSYYGSGSGYASNWNYVGNRDEYYDRGDATNVKNKRPSTPALQNPEKENEYYGGGQGRPRDPYEGYRGTSYLYGRPTSTTTNSPSGSSEGENTVTINPQQNNSSG